MCIVWAVRKLRQFLLGVRFTVYTDCQALVYLNSLRGTSSQIARWHDYLQEFDFAVKYRPGVRMGHVDALSRAPIASKEEVFDEQLDVCVVLTLEERVRMCQASYAELLDIKKKVEAERASRGAGMLSDYEVEDGLLYRRFHDKLLFVMPKAMRKSLVVSAHDLSGHPDVDKTKANIRQDFWFTEMKRYVRFHIRMCFECLMVKVPRGKQPGLLHSLPIGDWPFETVHADHVGPFLTTERGCRYVLVFVDSFTKFVLFYALAGTSADETVQCVKRLVGAYGLPKRLVTDRGTSSTAHSFATYCEEQGIIHVLASSRHPQTNGQVERVHSALMSALITTCVEPEDWDLELLKVQNNLISSESKVTRKTPFELLHGYRPRFKMGNLRHLSMTEGDW